MREDLRAIAVFLQHSFNGGELARDFADPDNGRPALVFGVVVVFGHAATVAHEAKVVKNPFEKRGMGVYAMALSS